MDATDVQLLEVSGTGVIFGQAYLDLSGNGAIDSGDAPLVGARVLLASPSLRDTLVVTTTGANGLYVITAVPVGTHALALESRVLGDSLVALGPTATVTVALGDTAQVNLGVSYPHLTLEQVRGASPGRRVFTTGVALNPRQNFSDGEVYLKGATTYLRATNVERIALATGDSVRLLGRTRLDNGQPVLDSVTPRILVPQAQIPVPVEVTPGLARTAGGGALDAALVRIRNAEITDTSTMGGSFHFWAYVGADSVEVVLRHFLGIPTTGIRPDTVVRISQAAGLLSPRQGGSGSVRWRLLPRDASDIVLEVKTADLAVETAFDRVLARVSDTVEIRVAVRNLGPHVATGVAVSDTVPSRLAFLSSSATRGAYDPATRTWTVGDLPAGAPADTLRIRARVVGPAGTATNTARILPLRREVEPGGDTNDVASASLTIS
jgi:uncharacterized repeat protein (TIGR01451 family)